MKNVNRNRLKVRKRTTEVVAKLRFCRFLGSFEPIFDSFCGGCIKLRILPPQKESKIGQNNPKNRRTLSFATTSLSMAQEKFSCICPQFLISCPASALVFNDGIRVLPKFK